MRIRFYVVGEYGDDLPDGDLIRPGRPHYHAIIFGLPGCLNTVTRSLDYGACCDRCDLFNSTWGLGNVFVGNLTLESAGYVAGYTVKKMTSSSDTRLMGRYPEFCQPSTDPGIGVPAMWNVARSMIEHGLDVTADDVPNAVRMGASLMPYGRTLKRKLRTMIGRCEDAPPSTIKALKEGLLPLRQIAFDHSVSFAQMISAVSDGAVLNLEARSKLYPRRNKL